MIQTMSEYPTWAGERAILKVDEEDSDFPPSEKKLRSWLNDAVSAFRYAEQWNARVAKQLADRRTDEPRPASPKGDGAPGTVYSNYDEAVKKHGRPYGPFEPGRMLPYEA